MDMMKITVSVWCYALAVGCLLLGEVQYVSGACSEPLGVANAYITTTAPYNTGDRVFYRCYDGFTMSGTPSQLCGAGGSFSGTAPTCNPSDQAVTIRQTVTSPKDDNGWMMLAFGSFVGLILLLLIIFALVFFYFMYKRQLNGPRPPQARTAFSHQSVRHTPSTSYPSSSIAS